MNAFGYQLGYEIHFFSCSPATNNDSLNNVCKAIVFSGGLYWIAFHRLNLLSTSLMSSLSNVLTQINERKDRVVIGNEEYTFSAANTSTTDVVRVYFGIVVNHPRLSNRLDEQHDTLRLTRIDHEFNSISKDLLEKFRIVRTSVERWRDFERNYLHSALVCNGFQNSEELCNQLGRIKAYYLDILTINSSST